MNHCTPENAKSQEQDVFFKLVRKKRENKAVIEFLQSIGENIRADNVLNCGNHVGITTIDGIAKIVKADFCRERLCFVCAWRRQARFMAQMYPVLNILSARDYQFLFATLTVKNVSYDNLEKTIDNLMKGFHRLKNRKKVKRAWQGIVRSVELTYNQKTNTFHPHIHLLIAVKQDYFKDQSKYISQAELATYWAESMEIDYEPVVDVRKVDSTEKATVETLKYALKPDKTEQALSAFFYIMRGRRLISFCGVFQKIRAELKYSNFEDVLTDVDDVKQGIKYNLYTFDATGGVYRLSKEYQIL